MKIIIAGSRNFTDYNYLKQKLDMVLKLYPTFVLISGGAQGADKLGERYAAENGLKVEQYLADWNTHGKSAGYIRNVEMSKNADALITFWDSSSKGTKHMIDIATAAKLKVKIYKYD